MLDQPAVFHNFARTSNYFIYVTFTLHCFMFCSASVDCVFSLQSEGQFIICFQLLTGCWVNVLTAVFGYIIANCWLLCIKLLLVQRVCCIGLHGGHLLAGFLNYILAQISCANDVPLGHIFNIFVI